LRRSNKRPLDSRAQHPVGVIGADRGVAGRRRGPGMTGLALHKCRVDTVFDEVRNGGYLYFF